jgi:quercetin dioxygenase-like cupin family protein
MHETYVALGKANWRPIADGVERGELRATRPGAGAALLRFRKGSRVGDHVHPGGEELFLFTGRLRIGEWVLLPGDYLYTPRDGVNDAEALEDSIVYQSQPEAMRFLDQNAKIEPSP